MPYLSQAIYDGGTGTNKIIANNQGADASITGSVRLNGTVGFNGTAPVAKPMVSGAKGGNAALASLLTAMASYGLISDSTSA
jgi:hypothetical protein